MSGGGLISFFLSDTSGTYSHNVEIPPQKLILRSYSIEFAKSTISSVIGVVYLDVPWLSNCTSNNTNKLYFPLLNAPKRTYTSTGGVTSNSDNIVTYENVYTAFPNIEIETVKTIPKQFEFALRNPSGDIISSANLIYCNLIFEYQGATI